MPFKDVEKQREYMRNYQAKRLKMLKFYEEVDNIRREARGLLNASCVARRFCPVKQIPDEHKDFIKLGPFKLDAFPILHVDIKLPVTAKSIREATMKIAEEEDTLILVGEHKDWRCCGLEGLATAKKRNVIRSSGDFDKDLRKAHKRLCQYKQMPPYVVVTSSGRTLPFDGNMDYHPPFTAPFYPSNWLCDAQGEHNNMLIVKPSLDNFQIMRQDDVEVYKGSKGSYRLWEALGLNIVQPKSICEVQL